MYAARVRLGNGFSKGLRADCTAVFFFYCYVLWIIRKDGRHPEATSCDTLGEIMKSALLVFFVLAVLNILPTRIASASAGDVTRFQFGDVTILAISDATGDAPVSLMPGLSREQRARLVPSGSMKSFINVFVLVTPTRTILVDTGLGAGGKAFEALQAEGITPDKVDLILLSHLHVDHVSGMLQDSQAIYPNAEVWLAEEEASYWTSDEFMLMQSRERQPAFFLARQVLDAYADNIRVFAPNQVIVPGITSILLPGHTLGHSGFILESRGGKMLFWGDTMHFAEVQLLAPDVPVTYDHDPQQAVATRQSLLKYLVDEHIHVAGAHLPFPGVGTIAKKNNVLIFQPGVE